MGLLRTLLVQWAPPISIFPHQGRRGLEIHGRNYGPRQLLSLPHFPSYNRSINPDSGLNDYFPLSLLTNSLNNFVAGSGSRNPVTRYFLPSSRFADAPT